MRLSRNDVRVVDNTHYSGKNDVITISHLYTEIVRTATMERSALIDFGSNEQVPLVLYLVVCVVYHDDDD